MSSEHSAVEIKELTYRYGSRLALRRVSFGVQTGSLFALLGPNGSGKTTLFRIISTLLPTTRGKVSVFGQDVANDAAAVRRKIGVVFQSPALDIRLTVVENLRSHGNLYGLRGIRLTSRIADALTLVDLTDRADDQVHTLSGGLQRRIELAKAFLPGPQLLILDEPSTGLDPRARREVWDHLGRLQREHGTTIVLTTHLMDEAALTDRVAVLHEGALVALGSPQDLVSEIGGDVLLVKSQSLETLATAIRERFGESVTVLDGHLRIERLDAHKFITDLVNAFPDLIDAVTFGKPTLEDVFLHHTGQRWN